MIQLDQEIFFYINHSLHNRWFDALAPYYRGALFWLPLYVFFISYLLYNFRPKIVGIYLLAVIFTIGLADTTSSRLIKNTVQRLRPCNDDDLKESVKLLVPCGSGYSFTSSHATNHFALATFVVLSFVNGWQKRRRIAQFLLFSWAASIGFAQIYVGVHYPFDVLGGAILGITIGWLGNYLYEKLGQKLNFDLLKSQFYPPSV